MAEEPNFFVDTVDTVAITDRLWSQPAFGVPETAVVQPPKATVKHTTIKYSRIESESTLEKILWLILPLAIILFMIAVVLPSVASYLQSIFTILF